LLQLIAYYYRGPKFKIFATVKDFNTIQKSLKLLEVINQTTAKINHQNQTPRSR